jgi:hypothetical protein
MESTRVVGLGRHRSASGESAGAVKAGAAAEHSEGRLDGFEHSSTIAFAG